MSYGQNVSRFGQIHSRTWVNSFEPCARSILELQSLLRENDPSVLMPRTHGANKPILFAQILDPYEVTPEEFAQIKDVLFAHVYKALGRVYISK